MREDELKMNENTNKMRDRLIEMLQIGEVIGEIKNEGR